MPGSCVEMAYVETGIKDEMNESLFDNRRGFFLFVKKCFLYYPAYLPKFNWENLILNKNSFIFLVAKIFFYMMLISFPSFSGLS